MDITPCDTCPAPCCRKYTVDITVYDAYRIGTTLKMPMGDFAELVWSDEPDEVRRILFADEERYYRLRLSKVNEAEDTDRCVFLLPLKGRGICSIYMFRPEICRTYPTYYEGGVLATSGGKYCPENAWSIERMDVLRLRSDWEIRHRTRWLHDAMIDGWNERVLSSPATWTYGDFYGFVTTVLRELEMNEPGLFQRLGPGVAAPDPWTEERVRACVDALLRRMGWRTPETLVHARPELGRSMRKLSVIPPHIHLEPVKVELQDVLAAAEAFDTDGDSDPRL